MNFNVFQRISKYFQRKSGAFTLMELLIVISITTILAGVGVSFYVNQQKAKLLENTAQEITNYLRYAQQKSVSQEGGNQWGVYFDNLTSGSNFYALCTGTTTITTSEKKYLPAGMEFSSPISNSSSTISFNKLTGTNYDSIEKEIVIRLTSNLSARVIRLTANGLITSGEGEKGYWKFDEGSGTTAYDSTIYKNTGTLTNGPTWQAESNCVSGSCLSFNGSSSYVSVLNSPEMNSNSFSISLWFKPNVLRIQGLADKKSSGWTNGWRFFMDTTNGNIEFDAAGEVANIMTPVTSVGQWYFVTATYDSSTQIVKIYLNGIFSQQAVSVDMQNNYANNLEVASAESTRFNGLIDEPRIYNRALSPAEILQHYNSY